MNNGLNGLSLRCESRAKPLGPSPHPPFAYVCCFVFFAAYYISNHPSFQCNVQPSVFVMCVTNGAAGRLIRRLFQNQTRLNVTDFEIKDFLRRAPLTDGQTDGTEPSTVAWCFQEHASLHPWLLGSARTHRKWVCPEPMICCVFTSDGVCRRSDGRRRCRSTVTQR